MSSIALKGRIQMLQVIQYVSQCSHLLKLLVLVNKVFFDSISVMLLSLCCLVTAVIMHFYRLLAV